MQITDGLVTSVNANTAPFNNALNISDNTGGTVPGTQKKQDMIHATLPFVLRSAGFIECQGANPEAAGQFFGQILGNNIDYNRSDYLCGPTCEGLQFFLKIQKLMIPCNTENI